MNVTRIEKSSRPRRQGKPAPGKGRVEPRRVVKKKAKPRKPSKTQLRNRCDQTFSLFVRKRDRVCMNCGTTHRLQCAHIVSRRYLSTRWNPRNAVALCAGCHVFYTHRPIEWRVWVDRAFQPGYMQYMEHLALKIAENIDYASVLEDLRRRLEAA